MYQLCMKDDTYLIGENFYMRLEERTKVEAPPEKLWLEIGPRRYGWKLLASV